MGEPDVTRWPDLDDLWEALIECHNDVPALLRLIADRVMEALGDGCVITTVTLDGTALRPAAIRHREPRVESAMQAVLSDQVTALGEGIAGTVAADRRSMLLNDLPRETLTATTPPQFLPFVRDHPMRALLIVPLVASGELVGTLGAMRTESDEPYTLYDLHLLEALGERAALAMADAVAGPRSIGGADYEAIYRHNRDGVLLTTPDGHILAANPAACALLGRTERDIVRGGREAVLVPTDPRLASALAERAAAGHARAELTMRRGDGTTFEADVTSTIFTTPDRKVRAVVIFRDMSEEVAAREAALARFVELEQAADRDPLTGLWNRRGFGVAAEQALASADRDGHLAQILFIDLDGLKALNDAEGHAAGDAAILALARAIGASIRDADVACRLGGDEFLVLLVDASSQDVTRVIDRVRAELASEPADAKTLSFSTGSAERPPHLDLRLDELIEAADRDMYQQKVLHRLRRHA
ncbi:MAG TPA: diguanylate cyclase [Acidimicrobiales bacterium]|nr:diguanylate cyclase [Acidimicrobiales bacterium]